MPPQALAARTISKPIALLVCSSLLITWLAPFGIAKAGRASFLRGRAQGNGPNAIAGAPQGILPNLDGVKNQQLSQPIAPSSIPSTMRYCELDEQNRLIKITSKNNESSSFSTELLDRTMVEQSLANEVRI